MEATMSENAKISLDRAVNKSNLEEVKKLLTEDPKLICESANLLYEAMDKNDEEIFELLFLKFINNYKNKNVLRLLVEDLLKIACSTGKIKFVSPIIKKIPESIYTLTIKPFVFAINSKNFEIAKLLINSYPDTLGYIGKVEGLTVQSLFYEPIGLVIRKGALEIVKRIIELNTEFIQKKPQTISMLIEIAIQTDQKEIFDFLLQKYPAGKQKEKDSELLHLVAKAGWNLKVTSLLKRGFEPDIKKQIDTSKLNSEVKNQIKISEYIVKRRSEKEYLMPFNMLFWRRQIPKDEKLEAAEALKKVILAKGENWEKMYEKHSEVLNQGRLKSLVDSHICWEMDQNDGIESYVWHN